VSLPLLPSELKVAVPNFFISPRSLFGIGRLIYSNFLNSWLIVASNLLSLSDPDPPEAEATPYGGYAKAPGGEEREGVALLKHMCKSQSA
jgi:hypothetical protein